jgi:hypothetical protein
MDAKEAFDLLSRKRVVENESDIERKAWQTLKAAVLAQQTTNSDYTATLEDQLKLVYTTQQRIWIECNLHEVATRLNSAVKAQQNCA